ncbi:hypothetical protein ACSAZL_01120 [Methanosarcina sp. T3]
MNLRNCRKTYKRIRRARIYCRAKELARNIQPEPTLYEMKMAVLGARS